MELFKLSFSENTRTPDLNFRDFSEEFFLLSDGKRWISGGIYLCAPREFTNDFRIVILIQILGVNGEFNYILSSASDNFRLAVR